MIEVMDLIEVSTTYDGPAAPLQHGWYVSRRIPVAHDQAAHALADALHDPGLDDTIVHRSLRRAKVPAAGVVALRTARVFPGRLRLGLLTPALPVEVEVEPWSRSESVLGLRPTRRPPEWRSDRYFHQAATLLADLEVCMRDRIVETPEGTGLRRAS